MYLKRILIVAIVVLVACIATGKYFDGRYKKYWATLFFNSTDTILDKSKHYDIILLGNSRIHFGLNPFYIDSVTEIRSYNFGIGGSDAALLKLNCELYLQNHPAPKYVVIGADVSMIVAPKSVYNQYHFLYYLNNDIIYQNLKPYHKPLLPAKYLPFTKYCLFNEYNRGSLFKNPVAYEKFDHNIYKGFLNINRFETAAGKMAFGIDTAAKSILDSSINIIKDIVAKFKNAGTNVLLVSPPLKDNIAQSKQTLFSTADSVFQMMARKYDVLYLQAGKELHYDDRYFIDDLHLNEPGTRIFSRQVGSFLDSIQHKK